MMWRTYLVVVSAILALGSAQQITTTDDAGQTIFEIVSTDANDVLTTTTLSTASAASSSAARLTVTNTKIVGPLGRPPASTSTPSTTTGFTASPTITAVTLSIPAGTIIDYGDYQTSIAHDAAAQTGSADNAFFATATAFGFKAANSAAPSRVPLLPVSAVFISVLGSIALAWIMGLVA